MYQKPNNKVRLIDNGTKTENALLQFSPYRKET